MPSGNQVPFYLLPSLGGNNTLRSYDDYRFHDQNLAVVNVESRWGLWTHLDVALFLDAGNVAPERPGSESRQDVGGRRYPAAHAEDDVRAIRRGVRRGRLERRLSHERSAATVAADTSRGGGALRAVTVLTMIRRTLRSKIRLAVFGVCALGAVLAAHPPVSDTASAPGALGTSGGPSGSRSVLRSMGRRPRARPGGHLHVRPPETRRRESGRHRADERGRVWHVKQPPHDNSQGAEGPVEVVLSRVLSAVGYHQPPVYFLPSFTLADAKGTHVDPGGRFRLEDPSIKAQGTWSWRTNPFVGTRPYEGLLVILLVFNSWDLKDSNNTIYERHHDGQIDRWYVVRDLGAALGESGASGAEAEQHRPLRAADVHHRRDGRLRRLHLSRLAAQPRPPRHHGGRRAMGRRAAGGAERSPVARRVPRRRLSGRSERALHPEDQGEHRPGTAITGGAPQPQLAEERR